MCDDDDDDDDESSELKSPASSVDLQLPRSGVVHIFDCQSRYPISGGPKALKRLCRYFHELDRIHVVTRSSSQRQNMLTLRE